MHEPGGRGGSLCQIASRGILLERRQAEWIDCHGMTLLTVVRDLRRRHFLIASSRSARLTVYSFLSELAMAISHMIIAEAVESPTRYLLKMEETKSVHHQNDGDGPIGVNVSGGLRQSHSKCALLSKAHV